MKIYCNRTSDNILDKLVGKNVWILCGYEGIIFNYYVRIFDATKNKYRIAFIRDRQDNDDDINYMYDEAVRFQEDDVPEYVLNDFAVWSDKDRIRPIIPYEILSTKELIDMTQPDYLR